MSRPTLLRNVLRYLVRTRPSRCRRSPLCLQGLEDRLAPTGDTLASALSLSFTNGLHASVTSQFLNESQVNLYAVQLGAGDEVTASVQARGIRTDLRVFDASARQLSFADNTHGGLADPTVTFDAPADGVYYVGVSSYGNNTYDPRQSGGGSGGSTTGRFVLDLRRLAAPLQEFEGTSAPQGSNDTFATAQDVTGLTRLNGTLAPGDRDNFQFSAAEAGLFTVGLTVAAGAATAPRLSLFDGAGQLLLQSDDAADPAGKAQLSLHLLPGAYYAVASAAASDAGTAGYELDTTFARAQDPFASVQVGKTPWSVILQDLNKDGFPDLVTANHDDNNLSVLLGRSDGSFEPQSLYTAGTSPASVVAQDLNGDGIADLVAANIDSNNVSVLLGRGAGSFGPEGYYRVGPDATAPYNPRMVVVADVNGDKVPDVLTVNAGTNNVSVLLGQGDGTFKDPAQFDVGMNPRALATADFNSDGRLDIVASNLDSSDVSVLLGNGAGTFRSQTTYRVGPDPIADYQPRTVAAADVNADGRADLITFNSATSDASVFLGNGAGTFQPPVRYDVGTAPWSGDVVDVNADGRADIVSVNQYSNDVSMLLGNGDGSFQKEVPFSVGVLPFAAAFGDINGDGVVDVVTANSGSHDVSVLWGTGNGPFQGQAPLAVGASPYAVVLRDLNGDNQPDLLTVNRDSNDVSVLLGRGDGTFQPQARYAVGSTPLSVAVTDVNGDDLPDLVTANEGTRNPKTGNYDGVGSVSVLIGRGDGSYMPQVRYDTGIALDTRGVTAGDVNGDGIPDVIAANFGPGTVSVLLGKGGGTFLKPKDFPAGDKARSVAIADINRDGHMDLLVTNFGSVGTVSLLLGNGDGSFEACRPFDVGASPHALALKDLNADGILDLVTANLDANDVSVLLGTQDGGFLPRVTYAVGVSPLSVTLSDVNGDGSNDVVVANYGSDISIERGDGDVSVLLGRGDGTFQPETHYAVGLNPEGAVVGDVNSDGRPDLITTNFNSDNVSVLLGDGTGSFQAQPPLESVASAGVPFRAAPTLQDLNGDRLPDIVTLKSSGGLLFRAGLGGGAFAPAAPINDVSNPARSFTLVALGGGSTAIAAADLGNNSVSLYAWDSTTNQFHTVATFPTAVAQPARIASADLSGDGLGDLVIAGGLDDQVAIALQTAPGHFETKERQKVRQVGTAPTDIEFLSGDHGLDILVSCQESGVVTVMRNDVAHAFADQYRYRAGTGLYGTRQQDAGNRAVQSAAGTVAVAAGDFSRDGIVDLVVIDRDAQQLALLPGLGQGRFASPQLFGGATSVAPGQVVTGYFNGDGQLDVAVLMEDLGQVWVYLGQRGGKFGAPIKSSAGAAPRGFSVAEIDVGGTSQTCLLVGNASGNVLVLTSAGTGDFVIDRTSLQRSSLAIRDLNGDGVTDAVLADQRSDGVIAFLRKPGTLSFLSPLAVNLGGLDRIDQAPDFTVLAPLDAAGKNADLVVADGLANNLLVYRGLGDGKFADAVSYSVGDAPVAVTVHDLTGDSVPDIAVANEGSNDVSILIGQIDPASGVWSAQRGPTVDAGGVGPISVNVIDHNGDGVPDMLVVNSDGSVALLPGIGADGKGTGFFRGDVDRRVARLGKPIDQAISVAVPATPEGKSPVIAPGLLLAGAGGINRFDPVSFAFSPVFSGPAVLSFAQAPNAAFLVAAFVDNRVGLLQPDANGQVHLTAALQLPGPASAVASTVAPDGSSEFYVVTHKGDDPNHPDNPVLNVFASTDLVHPVLTAAGTIQAVVPRQAKTGGTLDAIVTPVAGSQVGLVSLVSGLPPSTTLALGPPPPNLTNQASPFNPTPVQPIGPTGPDVSFASPGSSAAVSPNGPGATGGGVVGPSVGPAISGVASGSSGGTLNLSAANSTFGALAPTPVVQAVLSVAFAIGATAITSLFGGEDRFTLANLLQDPEGVRRAAQDLESLPAPPRILLTGPQTIPVWAALRFGLGDAFRRQLQTALEESGETGPLPGWMEPRRITPTERRGPEQDAPAAPAQVPFLQPTAPEPGRQSPRWLALALALAGRLALDVPLFVRRNARPRFESARSPRHARSSGS